MTCAHHHIYTPECNEAGWICSWCGDCPGEPYGFCPQLDRDSLEIKVDGVLMALHESNVVYVSNGGHGESLVGHTVLRCRQENRFDQYTIALFLLEAMTPSHADYYAPITDGILAGKDPRNRCYCGKLANTSQISGGNVKRACSLAHLEEATEEIT